MSKSTSIQVINMCLELHLSKLFDMSKTTFIKSFRYFKKYFYIYKYIYLKM